MRNVIAIAAIAVSVCAFAQSSTQLSTIQHELAAQIDRIPIFDNHSHAGYADDPDVDAMTSPPGSSVLRLRPDNPELVAASKALFQYPYEDYSPDHRSWLVAKKMS